MDLLTILLLCAVFFFAASLVQLAYLFWTESRFAEKRTVKKRLLYISAGGRHGQEKLTLYRDRALEEAGFIDRVLFRLPRVPALDRMLLKAGVPLNATTFIVGSLALGGIGVLVGLQAFGPPMAAVAGIFLLALPFLLLKAAERSYYERFQQQLPEALDLLARAVRSGCALTGGLDMIAREMDDPIRSEFAAVVDEVNLGLTLKEALYNLCERVPGMDLRFFTIALLVQKETGGNIAEILDNISRLIRERFQFAQQVRALTAEGRYSAGILIALPILLFAYVYVVNYDYISSLWSHQAGLYMMYGAIVLQLAGAYFIRRIVSIEI